MTANSASAEPDEAGALLAMVLTSSDPAGELRLLSEVEQETFRDALERDLQVLVEPVAPIRPLAPAASKGCARSASYTSAQGRLVSMGVTVYEFYLDLKYNYDCNSINNIKITGATGRAIAPTFSFKGVSDRTEVVVPPNRGRAKAQFNFSYQMGPVGGTRSSCLGINVTVTRTARSVSSDSSCRTNP